MALKVVYLNDWTDIDPAQKVAIQLMALINVTDSEMIHVI